MVRVPKAKITEDPIHYAKINAVPQSRASKQGVPFTLLHAGSPNSLLQTRDTLAPGHIAVQMAMTPGNQIPKHLPRRLGCPVMHRCVLQSGQAH